MKIKLLNGVETIHQDRDLGAYFDAIARPGVFKGMNVTKNGQSLEVSKGTGIIRCVRSNDQEIFAVVHFDETEGIVAEDGFLVVEVFQNNINDKYQNNENGTNIARMNFFTSVPDKNCLVLAEISAGNIVPDSQQRVELDGSKIDNLEIAKLVNGGLAFQTVSLEDFNLIVAKVTAIKTAMDSYQVGSHTHPISDITGLSAVLDPLNNAIGTKVDKITGKGLSTNDFTNTLKTKLDGLDSSKYAKLTGGNRFTGRQNFGVQTSWNRNGKERFKIKVENDTKTSIHVYDKNGSWKGNYINFNRGGSDGKILGLNAPVKCHSTLNVVGELSMYNGLLRGFANDFDLYTSKNLRLYAGNKNRLHIDQSGYVYVGHTDRGPNRLIVTSYPNHADAKARLARLPNNTAIFTVADNGDLVWYVKDGNGTRREMKLRVTGHTYVNPM